MASRREMLQRTTAAVGVLYGLTMAAQTAEKFLTVPEAQAASGLQTKELASVSADLAVPRPDATLVADLKTSLLAQHYASLAEKEPSQSVEVLSDDTNSILLINFSREFRINPQSVQQLRSYFDKMTERSRQGNSVGVLVDNKIDRIYPQERAPLLEDISKTAVIMVPDNYRSPSWAIDTRASTLMRPSLKPGEPSVMVVRVPDMVRRSEDQRDIPLREAQRRLITGIFDVTMLAVPDQKKTLNSKTSPIFSVATALAIVNRTAGASYNTYEQNVSIDNRFRLASETEYTLLPKDAYDSIPSLGPVVTRNS